MEPHHTHEEGVEVEVEVDGIDDDVYKFRQMRFEQILDELPYETLIKDDSIRHNLNMAWEDELEKNAMPLINRMIHDTFIGNNLVDEEDHKFLTVLSDVFQFHLDEQKVFNIRYIKTNPDVAMTYIERIIDKEIEEKEKKRKEEEEEDKKKKKER